MNLRAEPQAMCDVRRSTLGVSTAVCLVLALGGVGYAWAAAADTEDSDPDIALAARLERGFTKLAQRVGPSVVSLQVTVNQRSRTWLEDVHRMGEQMSPMPERNEGSGVIIDSAGYIVTNEHVIHNALRIRVELKDGRAFAADVCGTDVRSDLAMLKLSGSDLPKDLPFATLADSDNVAVGQWALAVGNPFGLSNTLTVGVVSGRGRSMAQHDYTKDVFYGNLIQTDAAINPGNSGGPLFDIHGRVIGINTMIYSMRGISEGYGFAIPSNHLQRRVADLKAGLEIQYGWLGVQLGDLRDNQAAFNVPGRRGALIMGVIPNTPAHRAGLDRGMVVQEFDGVAVGSREELMGIVNETPIGRTVKVRAIDREGKAALFNVKISKRYSELVLASSLRPDGENMSGIDLGEDAADKTKDSGTFSWRGLRAKELAEDDRKKRGGRIEIIRVIKGSPADRAGLYEGAIVTELKHAGDASVKKLATLDDFRKAAAAASGPAALFVPLDGFLTIEPR